jgi:hypothetical protein
VLNSPAEIPHVPAVATDDWRGMRRRLDALIADAVGFEEQGYAGFAERLHLSLGTQALHPTSQHSEHPIVSLPDRGVFQETDSRVVIRE